MTAAANLFEITANLQSFEQVPNGGFMHKTLRLGTVKTWEDGRWMSVYCKVQFEAGRLSISGVEGPLPGGNCLGSCGQIDMSLEPSKIKLATGWTRELLLRFLAVWKNWHLNDMTAECEHQRARGETWSTHPSAVCPDCGYKLGSAWLKREVPEDVISFLSSLPDADRKPAWV